MQVVQGLLVAKVLAVSKGSAGFLVLQAGLRSPVLLGIVSETPLSPGGSRVTKVFHTRDSCLMRLFLLHRFVSSFPAIS